MCCWSAARSPIRWRTERWDSLRLLTPNWQSRLPGFRYDGDDPDGYRTLPEVIDFLGDYAKAISAPVRTHTTVTSVRSDGAGYRRAHGPRRLAVPDRRAGVGRVQRRARARFRRPRAAVGRHADGAVLPQSRSARRRRRAGGGRVVERHPDRPGASAFGASGDPVGGRAHAGAPRLSRQGHGMVDGRRRRARRALRRGRRHRAGAAGSFAAACRHARPHAPSTSMR